MKVTLKIIITMEMENLDLVMGGLTMDNGNKIILMEKEYLLGEKKLNIMDIIKTIRGRGQGYIHLDVIYMMEIGLMVCLMEKVHFFMTD